MRQFLVNSLFEIAVRARKSPWIETLHLSPVAVATSVRARKSPWIETLESLRNGPKSMSGLVRARGLKLYIVP